MKTMYRTLIIALILVPVIAFGSNSHEILLSLNDRIRLEVPKDWKFTVEKELTLRFSNIKVKPKKGESFSMMLYFKCDTPDLAVFDTPSKMKRSIRESSQKYLPHIVEKEITIKRIPIKHTYGYFTQFTDASLAQVESPEPGKFKYMTRGMVRLSADTALGYSIMSNSLDSEEYSTLIDYVYSFVKAPKKANKKINAEANFATAQFAPVI
ncbi:MAG: hypothetical protein N0C86_11400 [Candidatus Thiodiazotropha taylori]|nr:hypothetical protein [Candidatus Thiodiazotropha taylori]MCW4326592.1 hypothetical protein [Candidatus Thiodiazotropha taylori]